ncbi:MAG TPA: hypothetical protein VN641_18565 [Urbifossiella sp.]|nr:hypothetical protein [Urbifossiella sp.]
MPRPRLLLLCLLAALSAFSTGCCGRIRQCIANRWNAHHPCGIGYGGACCTPAYKMAAPAGCSTCGPGMGGMGGASVVYQGPPMMTPIPGSTPTIGSPMPLHGPTSVPSNMPTKQ